MGRDYPSGEAMGKGADGDWSTTPDAIDDPDRDLTTDGASYALGAVRA